MHAILRAKPADLSRWPCDLERLGRTLEGDFERYAEDVGVNRHGLLG